MTSPAAVPSKWGTAAFVLVLIALHLAPVWMVARFPTQDGPQHAYNALILQSYGAPESAAFRDYFLISRRPVPNWITHLILAGLMTAVSPATADKIVVSGYVIAFFLAGLYVVRALDRSTRWPLLVLLPLAYNIFLFFGFYNFDYSLAVLMLTIGYWLRHAEALRGRRIAILALLVTLLYFCHIVAFGIAAIVIGLGVVQATVGVAATGPLLLATLLVAVAGMLKPFVGWKIALPLLVIGLVAVAVVAMRRRTIELQGIVRRLLSAALPLLALAPAAVLSVLFVTGEKAARKGEAPYKRFLRLIDWAGAFHSADRLVSLAVVVLLLLVAATVLWRKLRRRAWQPADVLLGTAALSLGMTMVAPSAAAGGSYIIDRLALLSVLTLALWTAVQITSRDFHRGRGIALGAFAILGAVLLARDTIGIVGRARLVDEYVATAVATLPPGARAMELFYTDGNPAGRGPAWQSPVKFMLHALAWPAAERRAVDVLNYEAGTGYFPILFRPGLQFFTGNGDNVPPSVYVGATQGCGRIDYILLWTGGQHPPTPIDERCADELAADYHPIAVSNGRGWLQVYERNRR